MPLNKMYTGAEVMRILESLHESLAENTLIIHQESKTNTDRDHGMFNAGQINAIEIADTLITDTLEEIKRELPK